MCRTPSPMSGPWVGRRGSGGLSLTRHTRPRWRLTISQSTDSERAVQTKRQRRVSPPKLPAASASSGLGSSYSFSSSSAAFSS
jgi:hypothetical protein